MSQALWPFMSDSFQCFTSSCETVKLDLGWKQKILRVNDWQFVVIYRRNWLVVLYATNKSIQRNCSLNYPEGSHLTSYYLLLLLPVEFYSWVENWHLFEKADVLLLLPRFSEIMKGNIVRASSRVVRLFNFHFDKHLFSLG